jgi:glycosyltransferase involved in cell wall biosynthesis
MIESQLFVSVILPVRNEARFIERTLESVVAQDYSLALMETLVVDGMSEDGTREIIRRFHKRHPELALRILDNPKKIVPTGMNIGLKEAKGQIIVRLDGHTILHPDYISKSKEVLLRTGADCVGGLLTPIGEGWIGRAVGIAHSLRFGLGGGLFHRATHETEADTVFMGVFKKEIFQYVGNFDEELTRNQDIELNGRIRRAGGKIILSPQIRSIYFPRTSLKALWRQNFNNGLWLVRTQQKTPGALSVRHYVPLLFILGLFAGLIGTLTHSDGWIGLAVIMGSYTVACLGTTITAAMRHGWQFTLSLPLVFVTLHFSYGIGSIVGMWRAMFRISKS